MFLLTIAKDFSCYNTAIFIYIFMEIKMFELVQGLASKDFIVDLRLCKVLFESNANYPWIFLVPKKENVKNMTFLNMEERMQLMREMALCEEVMIELFKPDQTNVAMIGNKTPQLHVHIIARKEDDPDWPGVVWDGHSKPYDKETKAKIIADIKKTIMIKMADGKFCQH
jgi:diadenosine tetraphosphate (Ap4A) HIT family hydrolase